MSALRRERVAQTRRASRSNGKRHKTTLGPKMGGGNKEDRRSKRGQEFREREHGGGREQLEGSEQLRGLNNTKRSEWVEEGENM